MPGDISMQARGMADGLREEVVRGRERRFGSGERCRAATAQGWMVATEWEEGEK